MMKRAFVLLASAALSGGVHAIPLECAIDKRTDAHQCIAPSELREIGGIRRAPLYMGGPNALRKTSYAVHANCSTQVLHLKDADGVSFGGGDFSSTDMSRQLGSLICGMPIPKKK